ncbi:hypothetical protein V5799_019895 [Amblyomma americanum]|uniref:Uncharacterized protein n=1 Tax=Amblyomma americanum TaxID=6943 RepID=A0AAQ4EVM5_AMBAM
MRRQSQGAGVIDDRWVLPIFSCLHIGSRSVGGKGYQAIFGDMIRRNQTVFFAAPLLPMTGPYDVTSSHIARKSGGDPQMSVSSITG